MPFVYIHLVQFGAWIAINLEWFPFLTPFDPTLVPLAMVYFYQLLIVLIDMLYSQPDRYPSLLES